MLTHPTIDKLHQLRCTGMATALTEQLGSPALDALSFEERIGLLADRELTERNSRQMTNRNRLRRAKLRRAACVEDIDFRQTPRGLDKDLVLSLADGRWIRDRLNLLITGPGGGRKDVDCLRAHRDRAPVLAPALERADPQLDGPRRRRRRRRRRGEARAPRRCGSPCARA